MHWNGDEDELRKNRFAIVDSSHCELGRRRDDGAKKKGGGEGGGGSKWVISGSERVEQETEKRQQLINRCQQNRANKQKLRFQSCLRMSKRANQRKRTTSVRSECVFD